MSLRSWVSVMTRAGAGGERTDGPVSTQRAMLMSPQPTETMHDSTSLSDQDFGATWSRTTSDFSINYQKTYLDRCYDYDDYDSQLLKLLSALSVFFSRIWSLWWTTVSFTAAPDVFTVCIVRIIETMERNYADVLTNQNSVNWCKVSLC